MMAGNPLVSIITPSYNQAAYLEQTIRSVLAQDYHPVEYIIVDGASTDGSLAIIGHYASQISTWISEPDSGQAEAINKGLRLAKGEIVAWLNSDDLYLPEAIGEAVAALQSNPALGLVYGNAVTIDAQGRPIGRLTFEDWGLPELMRFRIICQPAVFMRRTALDRAGYLDPSYHFMLDHQLWIRIARLAPIQYIRSSLWAAARHHPGAKNVAQPAAFKEETLRILEWMESQADLAPRLASQRQHVLAGAYRLSARYLLDGGMPGPALEYYSRAILAWPAFALKHWRRMVYALLCLFGIDRTADRLRLSASLRQRKQLVKELLKSGPSPNKPGAEGGKGNARLANWPGLSLEN